MMGNDENYPVLSMSRKRIFVNVENISDTLYNGCIALEIFVVLFLMMKFHCSN